MLDITKIIIDVMGNASKTNNRDPMQKIEAIQVGGAAIVKLRLACISRKHAAIKT